MHVMIAGIPTVARLIASVDPGGNTSQRVADVAAMGVRRIHMPSIMTWRPPRRHRAEILDSCAQEAVFAMKWTWTSGDGFRYHQITLPSIAFLGLLMRGRTVVVRRGRRDDGAFHT